ncbi:MAG: hypothetical protein PHI19_00860 [Clostridia bacterium]|nr:hypothetical protein [Clostridia bacterium]
MKGIKYFFYYLLQFTWGLPQNLLGFYLFLKYRKCKKEFYHGAIIVYHHDNWGGVSLGMFIIIKASGGENWIHEAKIHEYGHSIQSLILGPLYLLVIGLPSSWLYHMTEKIVFGHVNEYYLFYPERWANYLGQLVTGEKMRLND